MDLGRVKIPHQNQSRLELNFDRSACKLHAIHAGCMQSMQAACRPVKMRLITAAFDWSCLVFLTLLPTSVCFFSYLIWPLFTPWVPSGLYFLLHENQLHPKIGKNNGQLPHTKKARYSITIIHRPAGELEMRKNLSKDFKGGTRIAL